MQSATAAESISRKKTALGMEIQIVNIGKSLRQIPAEEERADLGKHKLSPCLQRDLGRLK